jgi:hypothetical protein
MGASGITREAAEHRWFNGALRTSFAAIQLSDQILLSKLKRFQPACAVWKSQQRGLIAAEVMQNPTSLPAK